MCPFKVGRQHVLNHVRKEIVSATTKISNASMNQTVILYSCKWFILCFCAIAVQYHLPWVCYAAATYIIFPNLLENKLQCCAWEATLLDSEDIGSLDASRLPCTVASVENTRQANKHCQSSKRWRLCKITEMPNVSPGFVTNIIELVDTDVQKHELPKTY